MHNELSTIKLETFCILRVPGSPPLSEHSLRASSPGITVTFKCHCQVLSIKLATVHCHVYKQSKQETFINVSKQLYGFNTAHFLREGSLLGNPLDALVFFPRVSFTINFDLCVFTGNLPEPQL